VKKKKEDQKEKKRREEGLLLAAGNRFFRPDLGQLFRRQRREGEGPNALGGRGRKHKGGKQARSEKNTDYDEEEDSLIAWETENLIIANCSGLDKQDRNLRGGRGEGSFGKKSTRP